MKIYGKSLGMARKKMVVREDSKNNGTVFVVDLEAQRTEDELKDMLGDDYAAAVFAGCFKEVISSPKGDATEIVWKIAPKPINLVCENHKFEIDVHKVRTSPTLLTVVGIEGERSVRVTVRIEVSEKPLARYFVDNRRCAVTCAPEQADAEEKRDLPDNVRIIRKSQQADELLPDSAEPSGNPGPEDEQPDDIFPDYKSGDASLSAAEAFTRTQ
jgi:hypothetical protein